MTETVNIATIRSTLLNWYAENFSQKTVLERQI